MRVANLFGKNHESLPDQQIARLPDARLVTPGMIGPARSAIEFDDLAALLRAAERIGVQNALLLGGQAIKFKTGLPLSSHMLPNLQQN